MELLANMGQVESHFGLFGDSVSVRAILMHGLPRTYHRPGNHFGRRQWNCYVTWAMWNLVLVRLEIVLILTQDRCTVCAERTQWNS
jgi:hypothetical protein